MIADFVSSTSDENIPFLWEGFIHEITDWSVSGYTVIQVYNSLLNVMCCLQKRTLSEANSRRLSAIVAAPLFVMSPVSSFYFFSSIETGNTYVSHLLLYGMLDMVINKQMLKKLNLV